MQINLYATFRLIAGIKTIQIDLPNGATILEIIHKVVEKYPLLRNHWLDENNELHAHVHVFLNGADVITLPNGLATETKAEDTLDFFPPVAGGRGKVDVLQENG